MKTRERLLGIVSEGDLIGHAQLAGEQRRSWWQTFPPDPPTGPARHYAKSHGRTASDVMTKDVVAVRNTMLVAETACTLEEHRIKRVPVSRDGRLVGIVTKKQPASGAGDSRRVETDARSADRIIQEKLSDELAEQHWAHLLAKNIVVENGIVHLFGIVQSDEERHGVRLAAENQAGVKSVEDHLSDHASRRLRPLSG